MNARLLRYTSSFMVLWLSIALISCAQEEAFIQVPELSETPVIDGDLGEWKGEAFDSEVWDLERIQRSGKYVTKRNRLNIEEGEDTTVIDLQARYYLAWREDQLYFGAEVIDNVNDVSEAKHEPKRWYYKDAIALFLEAPMDTVPEKFGEGNHAFAFIADTTYPNYGAWWRHGTEETPYIEEPLRSDLTEYVVRFEPSSEGKASYILEAKIDLSKTTGQSIQPWGRYKAGQRYSCMIVHCDPDGGEYGGHLLIYGKGDLDSSWEEMTFTE